MTRSLAAMIPQGRGNLGDCLMRKSVWFPGLMSWHPLRPPTWRWHRARDLVARNQNASRKRDDEATCRAVGFIRRLGSCTTERSHQRLATAEPAIAGAYHLFQRDGMPLLELKARVLGRQSNRAIGRRLDVAPEIIGAFKCLFFDIEDRLDAPYYIANVAARLPLTGVPSQASLMLLSSYYHVPHFVDAWLDFLSWDGQAVDLSTVEGRNRRAIELFLKVHQLSDCEKQRWQLLQKLPFIPTTGQKMSPQRTVSGLFLDNLSRILAGRLPDDHQTGQFPESESPVRKQTTGTKREKSRKREKKLQVA